MEISSSFQNVWRKPTSTGRIISVTGVFQTVMVGTQNSTYYCDECGEVVVARETPEVCPESVDASISHRMKIHWIHGSVLHCGLSQHSDGQKTKELDYFYPNEIHW